MHSLLKLTLAGALLPLLAAGEQPLRLCIAGLVLSGLKKPHECAAFGKECTPERPLGAPMVSSEGACAAYFHYAPLRHARARQGGA